MMYQHQCSCNLGLFYDMKEYSIHYHFYPYIENERDRLINTGIEPIETKGILCAGG